MPGQSDLTGYRAEDLTRQLEEVEARLSRGEDVLNHLIGGKTFSELTKTDLEHLVAVAKTGGSEHERMAEILERMIKHLRSAD